jgi:hypothetical protein
MREETRLLIHALIYNYDNSLQYSNSTHYTIVSVHAHKPFAIAYSPSKLKVKLALDHNQQLRREPLPPASVMTLVQSIRPHTIEELREILHPAERPSQKNDEMALLYRVYLHINPAEEVTIKNGEIFIMGWTVEEFVRLCPMRFNPSEEERKFIQGLVVAVNDAAQQLTRGRGYPRGGPSRISIQVAHVHRLMTAVSRLPGIDFNPKSHY